LARRPASASATGDVSRPAVDTFSKSTIVAMSFPRHVVVVVEPYS